MPEWALISIPLFFLCTMPFNLLGKWLDSAAIHPVSDR